MSLDDREVRRDMDKASLRRNRRVAESVRNSLSDEDIESGIDQVRVARQRQKTGRDFAVELLMH